MSDAEAIEGLVARVAAALTARGATMATAESCTGGLVAAACTSRAGSSAWLERGVVTYSNAAKSELLDVAACAHRRATARSAPRSRARWPPACWRARRPSFAVAVTGIAGPDGGTPAKPVGTVWIATAARGEAAEATLLSASGDRAAVRERSVARALELVLARIEATPPAPR